MRVSNFTYPSALSLFGTLVLLGSLDACKVRGSSALQSEETILDPIVVNLRKGEIQLFPNESYSRDTRWVTSMVYEPLAIFNPIDQRRIPILAKIIDDLEDGSGLTVELKRNITWHPFTARGIEAIMPWLSPTQQEAPDDKKKEKIQYTFSAEDVLFTYRLLANAQMDQFEPYRIYFNKGMKVAIGKTSDEVNAMPGVSVFDVTSTKIKTPAEIERDKYKYPSKEPMRKLEDTEQPKPEDLPYFVKITWDGPHRVAARNILQIPILPKHILERDISRFDTTSFVNGFLSEQMIGTGPLLHKAAKPFIRTPSRNLSSLVLTKNPEYKREHPPEPRFEEVRFFEGEEGVDFFEDSDFAEQMRTSPVDDKKRRESLETGYYFISYNPLSRISFSSATQAMYRGPKEKARPATWQPPAFTDKRLRDALAYAVDYDAMYRDVFHNEGIRVTGPFPPGTPYAEPATAPIKTNVAKSKQLLIDAGWRKTYAGDLIPPSNICAPPTVCSNRIFLGFDASSVLASRIAGQLVGDWNRLGFKVELSPIENGKERDFKNNYTFEKHMMYRDYDVVVGFRNYPPLGEVCLQWHTVRQGEPATMNFASFSDPSVDKACDELERIGIDEMFPEMTEAYKLIHRQVNKAHPMTFLFAPPTVAVISKKVESFDSVYSPLDLIY